MFESADWSYRGTYIRKHGLTVTDAEEALTDPSRVVIDPDYNSKSGRGIRIIGYSRGLGAVVTVIVVEDEGTLYGVNAWISNDKDQRYYREEQ